MIYIWNSLYFIVLCVDEDSLPSESDFRRRGFNILLFLGFGPTSALGVVALQRLMVGEPLTRIPPALDMILTYPGDAAHSFAL